jgi:hypothetical protein
METSRARIFLDPPENTVIFYLGTHIPAWLERSPVPLFVSINRLYSRRRPLVPLTGWVLDSGAFTSLALYGRHVISAQRYVEEVRNIQELIPKMRYAVIQDWMCEPFMLKITGLTVLEHQANTIKSYLDLMSAAPEIPWMPVLQGYTEGDYLRCVDMYERAGVNLSKVGRLGVGSVCKRQGTEEIVSICLSLKGFPLHLFGVKKLGIAALYPHMNSCDSMAWSYDARTRDKLEGCEHNGNCANCFTFAMQWREELAQLIRGRGYGKS